MFALQRVIKIWCNIFALSKTVRGRPKLKTPKIKLLVFQMFPFWKRKKEHIKCQKNDACNQHLPQIQKVSLFQRKENSPCSTLFLEEPSQLMVPITDQSKLCHKYVNGYLKLSPDPTKERRATTTHSHHIYQECAIFFTTVTVLLPYKLFCFLTLWTV